MSPKISITVDALGNPVGFILTAGQVADICQAEISILTRATAPDRFRASISDEHAHAVSSNRSTSVIYLWEKSHVRCQPSRLGADAQRSCGSKITETQVVQI